MTCFPPRQAHHNAHYPRSQQCQPPEWLLHTPAIFALPVNAANSSIICTLISSLKSSNLSIVAVLFNFLMHFPLLTILITQNITISFFTSSYAATSDSSMSSTPRCPPHAYSFSFPIFIFPQHQSTFSFFQYSHRHRNFSAKTTSSSTAWERNSLVMTIPSAADVRKRRFEAMVRTTCWLSLFKPSFLLLLLMKHHFSRLLLHLAFTINPNGE